MDILQPTKPTTIVQCLQCQLLGHRRLTCTRVDQCREVPHAFWLGPVLLGGWLITMIAFVLAVR